MLAPCVLLTVLAHFGRRRYMAWADVCIPLGQGPCYWYLASQTPGGIVAHVPTPWIPSPNSKPPLLLQVTASDSDLPPRPVSCNGGTGVRALYMLPGVG